MEKSDHAVDNADEAIKQTRALRENIEVVFAQQQFYKKRDKRFTIPDDGQVFRPESRSSDFMSLLRSAEDRLASTDPDFTDENWSSQWYMVSFAALNILVVAIIMILAAEPCDVAFLQDRHEHRGCLESGIHWKEGQRNGS